MNNFMLILLVFLLVIRVFPVYAQEKTAEDGKDSVQPLVKIEFKKPQDQVVNVKAKKYVRNITLPNGFGESITLNDGVFYEKSGDVKADGGDILEYAIVVNATKNDVSEAFVHDSIPPFTEYIPGSTRLNGVVVDDVEGVSKVVAGMQVNDAGSPVESGRIQAGQSALVLFRVRVNMMLDLPSPTPTPAPAPAL